MTSSSGCAQKKGKESDRMTTFWERRTKRHSIHRGSTREELECVQSYGVQIGNSFWRVHWTAMCYQVSKLWFVVVSSNFRCLIWRYIFSCGSAIFQNEPQGSYRLRNNFCSFSKEKWQPKKGKTFKFEWRTWRRCSHSPCGIQLPPRFYSLSCQIYFV